MSNPLRSQGSSFRQRDRSSCPSNFSKNLLRTAEAAGHRKRVVKAGEERDRRYSIDQHVIEVRQPVIGIRGGKNQSKNKNNLGSGCEFAQKAGGKRPIAGDKQDHRCHRQDQDIPAENQNRQPPRELLLEGKNDEGRGEQELVCKGIKISAEGGALVQAAREKTIDSIRQSRNYQHQQCPPVFVVRHEDEKQRQKAEPEKRDLIGYCPDAALHCDSG